MGWCQAFGPQIQEGCDHSMVAGSRSCSCPECGVVCPGKFPGCTSVWAAGPQNFNLRRPTKQAAPRAPEAAPTNGKRSRPPAPGAPLALPAATAAAAPTAAAADRAAARAAGAASDDLATLRYLLEGMRDAIDALPARIAKVAGDAMRQQHNINKQDMAELWQTIRAEAAQITPPAEAARDSQVVIEEFDVRFQWLVNEISKRFMVLGNELVRVEERITDASHGLTATNGRADHPISANPS